ncbi:MAG: hypothetical protein HFG71_14040 [Hungatella sp.]|jgi:ABC-type molybdenum transport system ATPase subunit/photorepair protein PhrA|nr:hypothetical protein [Hungatella sp.]
MNIGTEFLNSISQKIADKGLRYKDTVIIGDNSSGKSLLLKMILEKKGKGEDNVIKIIVFMTKKKAHLPNTKQTGGLFSMLS